MKEVSFDLETLGTDPDCVILSIAATVFDFDKGVGETFYERLNKSHQPYRSTTSSTEEFWAKQKPKVREEAMSGKMPLSIALTRLHDWLPNNCVVWGNSSTFDISILEHAYKSFGIAIPWRFYNINDMRTIVRTANLISKFDKSSIKFEGDVHNAKDDSIHQAKVIIAAHNSLKGK